MATEDILMYGAAASFIVMVVALYLKFIWRSGNGDSGSGVDSHQAVHTSGTGDGVIATAGLAEQLEESDANVDYEEESTLEDGSDVSDATADDVGGFGGGMS